MPPKVTLSPNAIADVVRPHFEKVAEDLDAAFHEAITSDIWEYPRKTVRSTGETVFSPRDIVDTGALRDSQMGPLMSDNGLSAYFIWGNDEVYYAMDVLTGYVQNGARVPPRDWVTMGLDIAPPAANLQIRLRG